jgi:hypothetical protein
MTRVHTSRIVWIAVVAAAASLPATVAMATSAAAAMTTYTITDLGARWRDHSWAGDQRLWPGDRRLRLVPAGSDPMPAPEVRRGEEMLHAPRRRVRVEQRDDDRPGHPGRQLQPGGRD